MLEQNLQDRLSQKLMTLDQQGAADICKELIADIYRAPESYAGRIGSDIMNDLRSKRMFTLMQQVGDALILTQTAGFKVKKLYSQALIDQNYLVAAQSVIEMLMTETGRSASSKKEAKEEWMEARGLMGRIYKQLYINTIIGDGKRIESFLQQSIAFYYAVYKDDKEFVWHGINTVALLRRAERDGIEVPGYPAPKEMATEILVTIKERHKNKRADAWDFATAAEACMALGDEKNALEWLSGYARMPYADAFELASTLRQLEEVWQLDVSSKEGSILLPILRAELLKRRGGVVEINADDIKQQSVVSDTYKNLFVNTGAPESTLEKVFSDDSFRTYEWYKTGSDRCLAVARIGRERTKGFGTGFLMKGKALDERLGDELVILTNAHVVSEDPKENALRFNQALIIFEALNDKEVFRPSAILWSSPRQELDATILRFDEEGQNRLKEVTKNVPIYPVTDQLPEIKENQQPERIFIIGHPNGGTLQLSLHDNLLLDYDHFRIHYRTPTAVGHSGSPVFNNQWELIGLHHAGSRLMKKLNGKEGKYEANEGIWMEAIKKALKNIPLE